MWVWFLACPERCISAPSDGHRHSRLPTPFSRTCSARTRSLCHGMPLDASNSMVRICRHTVDSLSRIVATKVNYLEWRQLSRIVDIFWENGTCISACWSSTPSLSGRQFRYSIQPSAWLIRICPISQFWYCERELGLSQPRSNLQCPLTKQAWFIVNLPLNEIFLGIWFCDKFRKLKLTVFLMEIIHFSVRRDIWSYPWAPIVFGTRNSPNVRSKW